MLDYYEDFMAEQRSKMLAMLQQQKRLFGKRNAEELHKLIRPLYKEDFTRTPKEAEVISIYIYPILHSFVPVISEIVSKIQSSEGLYLTSNMIKIANLASLKTLGVSIHVKGNFNGVSDLVVFTRCFSLSDSSNAVIRVSRVMDSVNVFRYFLHFGACRPPNHEFVSLKSQELPGNIPSSINLKVIDNGNNFIYFRVKLGRKEYFETMCDLFVPTLEDFPVMVAGTRFRIDQLTVKQVRRRAQPYKINKEQECCALQ